MSVSYLNLLPGEVDSGEESVRIVCTELDYERPVVWAGLERLSPVLLVSDKHTSIHTQSVNWNVLCLSPA